LASCDYHNDFLHDQHHSSDKYKFQVRCRRDLCPSGWFLDMPGTRDDIPMPSCGYNPRFCKEVELGMVPNANVDFQPGHELKKKVQSYDTVIFDPATCPTSRRPTPASLPARTRDTSCTGRSSR
jgi:hypothetical protein